MTTETSLVRSLAKNWQKTYGYLSGRFVRISSLRADDKPQIAKHLFLLPERDRYYRFGFAASDKQIQNYVDGLNFERDHLYGIYGRQADLIAVAHLAQMEEPYQAPLSFGLAFSDKAEFGVSVLPEYRSKGYGGRLFDRAMTHARNQGTSQLHIQALSENSRMLNIAKKRGATLVNHGSETEAYLLLPEADLDSRISELVAEHFGNVDYEIAHKQNPHKALALQGF
jgi:RimJ/RimL family protein N-acetyltransferase